MLVLGVYGCVIGAEQLFLLPSFLRSLYSFQASHACAPRHIVDVSLLPSSIIVHSRCVSLSCSCIPFPLSSLFPSHVHPSTQLLYHDPLLVDARLTAIVIVELPDKWRRVSECLTDERSTSTKRASKNQGQESGERGTYCMFNGVSVLAYHRHSRE
jgi:hypothetical protein